MFPFIVFFVAHVTEEIPQIENAAGYQVKCGTEQSKQNFGEWSEYFISDMLISFLNLIFIARYYDSTLKTLQSLRYRRRHSAHNIFPECDRKIDEKIDFHWWKKKTALNWNRKRNAKCENSRNAAAVRSGDCKDQRAVNRWLADGRHEGIVKSVMKNRWSCWWQWAERNNNYKVVCGCAANRVVHDVPYNENYKRKNVSAQVASLAYFRAMRRKILLRKLKHIAQIRHNEKQIVQATGFRRLDFRCVCVCFPLLFFHPFRSSPAPFSILIICHWKPSVLPPP